MSTGVIGVVPPLVVPSVELPSVVPDVPPPDKACDYTNEINVKSRYIFIF